MIIDGKEVPTTATFPDVSPADIRVVLGLFQHGTKAHAKRAIKAARAAFRTWSATPWAERVRIVQRAADLSARGSTDTRPSCLSETARTATRRWATLKEAPISCGGTRRRWSGSGASS